MSACAGGGDKSVAVFGTQVAHQENGAREKCISGVRCVGCESWIVGCESWIFVLCARRYKRDCGLNVREECESCA